MAKKIEILENCSLKKLTTFKIGGKAKYFTAIKTDNEAIEAIEFANQKNLPIFVLGSGSNILVNDDGFSGLVIHNKIKGIKNQPHNGLVMVNAGAGEDWDDLVQHCIKNKWPGLECLSGIPGTVGASSVQNIGAYGKSANELIQEVQTIDLKTGILKVFSKYECKFGYRVSIFNTEAKGRYLITDVSFILPEKGHPKIQYASLKEYFASEKNPEIAQVRLGVLNMRAKKGMVIMPGHECYNSAGSFFKNPVVSRDTFKKVITVMESEWKCKDPWFWELAPENVKISAACLINHSGFYPGFKYGKVGISPKHALALINIGNGTATEMVKLARIIQEKVKEKYDILLEPEVQLIGFNGNPLLQ